MGCQAAAMGQIGSRTQVIKAQHAPADGIFQRQQATAGEMEVVRLDGRGNIFQRQTAIGLVRQRLRLDAAQNGSTAAFILIGVGLLADDVFIAAPAVRQQRDQIGLGAGRRK